MLLTILSMRPSESRALFIFHLAVPDRVGGGLRARLLPRVDVEIDAPALYASYVCWACSSGCSGKFGFISFRLLHLWRRSRWGGGRSYFETRTMYSYAVSQRQLQTYKVHRPYLFSKPVWFITPAHVQWPVITYGFHHVFGCTDREWDETTFFDSILDTMVVLSHPWPRRRGIDEEAAPCFRHSNKILID